MFDSFKLTKPKQDDKVTFADFVNREYENFLLNSLTQDLLK